MKLSHQSIYIWEGETSHGPRVDSDVKVSVTDVILLL